MKRIPKTTRVQSVIFSKSHWTAATSKKWLGDHGYKTPKSDTTDDYYRYRQEPTFRFQKNSFRTIEFDKKRGIKAVIARPLAKNNPEKASKTRTPSVPKQLVYLGRAIEVDADTGDYGWKASDGWIVASNEAGNRIIVFQEKKLNPTKAEILYRKFNHKKPHGSEAMWLEKPKIKLGRVGHIVYRSSKSGRTAAYIHTFDHPPVLWVDKRKNPKILVLVGGKIRVTARGIEG